jgi:hypothetical protein
MNNDNLKNEEQCAIPDAMCSCYVVRFNEPDLKGNVILKEAVNFDNFQQMKIMGEIVDYEIDDNGVKVIKKFNLTSVSL